MNIVEMKSSILITDQESLLAKEQEQADDDFDLEMPPDDDGVIAQYNTQRVPVSLIKQLEKTPSNFTHFGRNQNSLDLSKRINSLVSSNGY